MIVLVCGGRDYCDHNRLSEELSRLEQEAGQRITGLIHGAARGADSLAKEWMNQRILEDAARVRKLPKGHGWRITSLWCAGYPADWGTHGKAAGPIRNQHMLDQNPGIELVVAFPGGSGTADMVRRAKAKGIKVHEVPAT